MATNNIFSMLRLANIFGGNQNPQQGIVDSNPNAGWGSLLGNIAKGLATGNPSNILNPDDYKPNPDPVMNATSDQGPAYNPDKDFLDLYKPRTDISNAYTQSLLNAPERNNPGALRNIGAIVGTTLSNVKNPNPERALQTFNDVRFAPYERAMEDWTAKNKALQAGALEEDKSNTNARLLAQEQVAAKERDAQQKETERKNKVTEANNAEKLKVSQARAQAYIWRQTHPQWQAAKTKGGNLIYVDPTNPQNTYDTGIPMGTLTDQEMQDLITNRQTNEISARGEQIDKQIQERGNVESGLINQRTNAQSGLIKQRGEQQRQTNAAKPGANTSGTTTITTGPQGTTTRTTTKSGTNDSRRNAAIALLTSGGQKVTDANIKYVLDHPEKYGIK